MVVCFALIVALAQSPTAPAQPAATTGTAVIGGQVIDKSSGAPLAHAVVSLRNARDRAAEQKFTDDRGRFEFNRVLGGQYELRAAAGVYRATHVGAGFPETSGQIGPLLTVKDGEERTDIVIALGRALAINGRVTDEAGNPLAHIGITVTPARGTREFVSGRERMTDDRGMFRIHGLAPGRYTICAATRWGPDFQPQMRRKLQYVRTCYPAATDTADAVEITLSDAEVDGIEIRMPRRPTFLISGSVVTPEGLPPTNAMVMVMRIEGDRSRGTGTQLSPTGTFVLSNVQSGTYEVSARLGRSTGGYQPDDRDPQWGAVRFEVTTADVEGLVVVMKPSVTIKGRVVFEDPPQTPAAGSTRISAHATTAFSRSGTSTGTLSEDGTFEIKDVFGPVVLRVDGPAPAGYVLKSVMYRGRDVMEVATEFDGNPAHDVQLVLTSRTAELSGRVLDELGNPVPRATIVRFPAEQAQWKALSNHRSIGVTRTGTYRMTMLPAGEYFVVAMLPDEMTALKFPDDYDRIAAVAERISVVEHDRRTADLRLVSIPPRRKQ